MDSLQLYKDSNTCVQLPPARSRLYPAPPTVTFQQLPSDIHQRLMTFLTIAEFRELACTCRQLYLASQSIHVHLAVLENELRPPPPSRNPSSRSFVSDITLTLQPPMLRPAKATVERTLHMAMNWENVGPILELLLERVHDKHVLCADAFVHACGRGCIDLARMLLTKYNVSPGTHDNLAIVFASKHGRLDVVDMLMKYTSDGVDLTAGGNRAFRLAARHNQVGACRLLLRNEAIDPSAGGNEAIRVASKKGYVELISLLLSDGRVDPGVGNNMPIRLASRLGHVEAVRVLLEDRRVDPAVNNHEALTYVTRKGREDIVVLLRRGIRIREPRQTWSGNRNPMLNPLHG
eukprot:CFRG8301T1